MKFNKYFAFLAIVVLCLLGQQAAEAHHHHHHFGKIGRRIEHAVKHAAKTVHKVAHTIDKAKKVIEAGGIVAGAIAATG